MLYTKIDASKDIAVLEADAPLTKVDFENSTEIFREHTNINGRLRGLIIYTEFFPGWGSIRDFPYHMKYATEHNKKAKRIAFVTNSLWSTVVKLFGRLLTGTQTKVFSYSEFDKAEKWVLSIK